MNSSTSRNDIWKWLALLIIAVFSIYVTFPVAEKLRFGLDLKGGTSFTLGVDKDKLRETIIAANPTLSNDTARVEEKINETLRNCDARIIQVVRRRVDGMGMNEPVIQGMKDHRLLVQLPGIDEDTRARAKQSLQSAAFLEFRLTHPKNDQLVAKLLSKDVAPEGYKKSGSGYARDTNWAELSKKPGYAARLARFEAPDARYSFMLEDNGDGTYSPNFVARSIGQHGALRRQIIILDEDDVEVCRVEACLDMPLPEITWALLGPKENIRGLFLADEDDSAAALWYDGDLSPKKPRYETADLGDVRLQVRYGTVVAILGKGTKDERKFETLAAAVDEANYGDTISIVGDVRGESVKVPIGMTVVVEQDGKFREPDPGDLRHKYYKVTTRGEGGKTYYTYGLDEEMVVPRIGASDGTPAMEFVRDEEGKAVSVKLNVENVYEDLYYVVYWGLSPLPEEMVPVTWECAGEDGTIRVEAPADEESGFYRIRVTDHLGGDLLW